MARAWFFLVLLNSSSFSATRLSISCLTCPSSSWARRTLFSSCSRVPSASSRAPCSSSFSVSILLLCLSSSWMERPPSPSWSRRSLISSARFLFSRLTMSSCWVVSSKPALTLKRSLLTLRASLWLASTSATRSSCLAFSIGLGKSLESIRFLLRLLINTILQVLKLSAQVLEPGKESSTVTSLRISQPLSVFQLGGKGDFALAQGSNGSLNLINLAAKILVLNLKFLPGRVSLIQSTCQVIQFNIGFNNESSSKFSIPLMVSTVPHALIKSSTCLLQVTLHTSLVFFSLCLHFVEAINLFSHLSHVVVVFLPQSSQSSFMSYVGLIKITLKLGQFSFPLLVELNLGGSVVASILKLFSQISNIS